jgi:hypothetical protein
MKRNIKILVIAVLLLTAPLLIFAQPHPNNGNGAPGAGNTPVGGSSSAPIGNGTFLLLTLAMAYAGRKVYVVRANPAGE